MNILLNTEENKVEWYQLKSDIENQTDVRNIRTSKILENRNEVKQFVVMSV